MPRYPAAMLRKTRAKRAVRVMPAARRCVHHAVPERGRCTARGRMLVPCPCKELQCGGRALLPPTVQQHHAHTPGRNAGVAAPSASPLHVVYTWPFTHPTMTVEQSSKPLAFAVAAWLQGHADAQLQEAGRLVATAAGVNPASAADKEAYAKNSPGLEAIFDVFLKTQQRMAPAKPAEKQVDEADAEKAESLKNEGNKFMSAKDYGAALDAYTKAIELNGGSPVFYSNRAAAYSQIGQHDEAIADAKKAAEIDPHFGKAYSRLGHALFASGRFAEAAEAYEKGVEVDPSNKLMKSGLDASRAKMSDGAKDSLTQSRADPLAGAGAGTGAGAGAGGMPDMASLMNNPMVSQMAQQMCVARMH